MTERHLIAFTLHDPEESRTEVDLLAVSPIPFEDRATDAEWVEAGDTRVRIASVPHLIEMKRHSGRSQDLADIEALAALLDAPTLDDDDCGP